MKLLAPDRLWLLILVVALVAAYVPLQRLRRHRAVRLSNASVLAAVSRRGAGWRRHLTAAGVLLALVASIVGLARPASSEQVPRDEATVVLAIDISGSMTSTDVAPTRMQAAVKAAKDFIADAPERFEIGLVTFDVEAHTLVTPTTDRAALARALDRLERGPGTAAGEGLYEALDVIAASTGVPATDDEGAIPPAVDDAGRPFAAVVLLADGASTVGRSVEDAADAAGEQGVPVFAIAFGTPDGTAEVSGRTVPVPADPASMREAAERSGGVAYEATTGDELDAVYDEIGARVGSRTETREHVLALTAAAAVALTLAIAGSILWGSRLV